MVTAHATARTGRGGVDARATVELRYPTGVPATATWDLAAAEREMTWTVTGSAGSATVPAFAVPHLDPRILEEHAGATAPERMGDATSYTYQLDALAATIRTGRPFRFDLDDSVRTAQLMARCRQASGLSSGR